VAQFAIVRADGSIDKAEGASVQDVSDRYGWPGDGTIRPLEAGDDVRHSFDSVEHQGTLINDKPKDAPKAEAPKGDK
jgi:predicted heme/steroid binding protein